MAESLRTSDIAPIEAEIAALRQRLIEDLSRGPVLEREGTLAAERMSSRCSERGRRSHSGPSASGQRSPSVAVRL
jgi:hypothetical protein